MEKIKLKIPTKKQRVNYQEYIKRDRETSKYYCNFSEYFADMSWESHEYLCEETNILYLISQNPKDAENRIKELYETATPKKAVDELAKLIRITNQKHYVKDDGFGEVLRLANPNNKKESQDDPSKWIIRSEDFALTWSKEAQEKFIDSITMTLTQNHSLKTDRMYDFLASQIRPIKKLTAETRVTFTTQDFIKFLGKENTKENRKEYKKHIIQELIRLHDAKVGFKQGNRTVVLSFIQGYQLLDSNTFEFATTTYYNQYINPIRRIYKTPAWLNQLNLKQHGLVRIIAKKLISQLHQNAQDGNTLSLSVAKLIETCLGHLQEDAKNKTELIRKPIEKALNHLKEIGVLDYNYYQDNKTILFTPTQIREYKDWEQQKIMFTIKDPDLMEIRNHANRIEKNKIISIEQAKEKRNKKDDK